MATKKTTESQEQQWLFDWADYMWKTGKYPELEYLYHVPNGGYRSKRTAGRLKKEGLKPGVPDVALDVARGKWHGLRIEMKVGRNQPTENQMRWGTHLLLQGYFWKVCYGWEEASKAIEGYLSLSGDDRQ